MEARFFCRTGALAGSDYRIDGDATIGRGPSNTIVVADGVVSKTHARILFEPAAASWVLEDRTARTERASTVRRSRVGNGCGTCKW